tara:strand:- start:2442 stop:3554 length:1113 start_codon:yes stop_codon:yes gene_type:complete
MSKFDEFLNLKLILILSFIFILITNNYFSYNQSLIFGARDGADYYLIANNFPNIPFDILQNHKAWRFIIPALIGLTAKIINIELYLLFRIFVFIFSIMAIVIFFNILTHLKINNFHIFFLTSFLIFNPYLFRYFLACPTMINDLIFVNAVQLLFLGILKKNRFFYYIGILLSIFSRQNSIFILLSIIIVKFIFKKNSALKIKDVIISIVLFFLFFSLNTSFANFYSEYNNIYSFSERFALFKLNYSFLVFLEYNMFVLIILLPLFGYLIIEKKNFYLNKINLEVFILISLVVFFTILVAYAGGPVITGKNIVRLINLAFPLIILIGALSINFKRHSINSIRFYLFLLMFSAWSLHPTFSKVKIFSIFNFS